MNNTLKIVILSIITCLLVGLLITIIYTDFNIFNFKINKKNTLLYNEEYKISDIDSIKIESISTDIKILKSNNENVKIELYGDDIEDYKVDLTNNNLNIKTNYKNKVCIGFCFSNDNIIIYLPDDFDKDIELSTVSGDISIEHNINSNVNIKTISGDVSMDSINNVNAKTTSGDIDIKKANDVILNTKSGDINIGNINNIEAEAISGDIEINSININKDCYLKTVSGEITIKNSNSIYYETKTTSGDIEINNNDRYANNTMKLTTVSGDINVK